MSITCLENLSNEILYEIFEYLDIFSIYNIFSNLNIRFEYLLKYSSLSIKLNLSWISKRIFQSYCQYIIKPNLTQIISIKISNPLTIKSFLLLFPMNISFPRLESLNIGRTDSNTIISLLIHLKFLPRFFSLSLCSSNPSDNMSIIYQLITTLPVLKYCKISSENNESIFSLPILSRNIQQKESSIKYLILNGTCRLDQFDAILSYIPQLTHLSCHSLKMTNEQISDSIININLKKLYINLNTISFNQFKIFLCKIASQLEILFISGSEEKIYFDANQWQELISYYMPHLRIFDIQLKSELCNTRLKSMEYDQLIEKFNSNFWTKRHWFFTYENCRNNSEIFKIFYSIHPYRRKYYKLYETTTENFYQSNPILMSEHILIENQWNNKNSYIQFPYATKLTLTGSYAPKVPLWILNLNRIVSLNKITELILDYEYLFMNKLFLFLEYIPNIYSLIIPQISLIQSHKLTEYEINIIENLSEKNFIKKITILRHQCTLKQLQFLFKLFLHIEYLSIEFETSDDLILQFLISKTKEYNSHLCFLSFNCWNINEKLLKKLQSITDHHYSLDIFKGNVYLWC